MSGPPFDPATARALDAFTVPVLSADFADRLVARALAAPVLPALPPVTAARRGWRRGWRRGGAITAGIAAFGLMSAAAAATGIFGEQVRQHVRSAPVLGIIIASVVPERHLVAKPKPAKPVLAKALPKVAPPPVVETAAPVIPQTRAERITARIERRIEKRRALGLPVRRDLIRQKLRQLPPEERAEVIGKLKAARQERREAIAAMSPDERNALRERLRTLRAERRARREARQFAPPVDAAPHP